MSQDIAVYVKRSISNFIGSSSEAWEWDDFLSSPIKDSYYDALRKMCLHMPTRYPPEPGSMNYCNAQGDKVLSLILDNII